MDEFRKVVAMPDPTPRRSGGTLFMMAARFGEANSPVPIPFSSKLSANLPVGEVDREDLQQPKRARGDHHAAGVERPCAERV